MPFFLPGEAVQGVSVEEILGIPGNCDEAVVEDVISVEVVLGEILGCSAWSQSP